MPRNMKSRLDNCCAKGRGGSAELRCACRGTQAIRAAGTGRGAQRQQSSGSLRLSQVGHASSGAQVSGPLSSSVPFKLLRVASCRLALLFLLQAESKPLKTSMRLRPEDALLPRHAVLLQCHQQWRAAAGAHLRPSEPSRCAFALQVSCATKKKKKTAC